MGEENSKRSKIFIGGQEIIKYEGFSNITCAYNNLAKLAESVIPVFGIDFVLTFTYANKGLGRRDWLSNHAKSWRIRKKNWKRLWCIKTVSGEESF